MYCSSTTHHDSDKAMRISFEPLLFKNKVDISFTGTTLPGSTLCTYAQATFMPMNVPNPFLITLSLRTASSRSSKGTLMLHFFRLIDSNGGNHEGLYNKWETPLPKWSAFRDGTTYGNY